MRVLQCARARCYNPQRTTPCGRGARRHGLRRRGIPRHPGVCDSSVARPHSRVRAIDVARLRTQHPARGPSSVPPRQAARPPAHPHARQDGDGGYGLLGGIRRRAGLCLGSQQNLGVETVSAPGKERARSFYYNGVCRYCACSTKTKHSALTRPISKPSEHIFCIPPNYGAQVCAPSRCTLITGRHSGPSSRA